MNISTFQPSDAHWAWADSVSYRERVSRKQAQSVLLNQPATVFKNGETYLWKTKHLGAGIYEIWLEKKP